MNTIDALAETQEKYNKLQSITADLLSDIRDIQEKFLMSMKTQEQNVQKGVITDTEFMFNTLECYKMRDAQLAQAAIQWELRQN